LLRSVDPVVPMLARDVSRQRFEVFAETIRAARVVHTDRLHILLLAAMLGKKVFAYTTSHAKLEGVYRHSLAAWADVTIVAS
jgi:exopolysaccharide biosynthesis predicted pyruvyltransferase EpsI